MLQVTLIILHVKKQSNYGFKIVYINVASYFNSTTC